MAETALAQEGLGGCSCFPVGLGCSPDQCPQPHICCLLRTVSPVVPQFPLCAGDSGAPVPGCPGRCAELC